MGKKLTTQETIEKWIFERLSQKQLFLANLPPCPYALDALLKNEIRILDSSSDRLFGLTEESLVNFYQMPFRMHVIAVKEWAGLPVESISQYVKMQREIFYKRDLWLLYDHPDSSEIVNGHSFNHGELLIFMVQKLSDLVLSSRHLKSKDYYQAWPQNYYEEVVLLREKYYEKYLQEHRSAEQSL